MEPDKTQAEINAETNRAITSIASKTDEMYEILIAFRLFGKAIMWIALFVGSVATAGATAYQAAKLFFKK